ncbi:Hexokinase [Handroanthus impetiginosus]|uniref:Phosphotransferase n=1 Tax=Handroanthus impetiginosus TaxID=429701 RepID=A0A2G9G8X8_9LAMI|nr:Hexokinase [Handroanthus impetiginosus]
MKKEVAVAAAVSTAAALVGVAVLVRHYRRRSERRWRQAQAILRKFARQCATPAHAKLWHVANELASDMEAELSSTEGGGNLRMLVSYVDAPLPTGEEKGTYYGINLRGTNFLLVRATLEGKNEPVTQVKRQEVAIPSAILMADTDSTRELCDFMALELAKFVSVHSDTDTESQARERKLGFTVSFTMDQSPASSSIACKWNRLSVDDTVGKELTTEINKALEKHSVNMRVPAVVYDTIGNLAGGRYYSKESVAAVSLGQGTDVAYIESPQQITETLNELSKSADTVIHMQWGNFTSSHLPLTEYDISLDAESIDPGSKIFEKLISGMYLGEIVRRVLLKMAKEAALFGDLVPPKLFTPYLLRSPDMAAMHQDISEDYGVVEDKLKEIFDINNSTPMVREIVAEVCDVVAERGARLVGAGIVGIVKKMGRISNKKSVITIEGGLYEHYRIFRNYLHSSVWEMLGSELSDNVIIEHSHGGSGAGSIFLAASQTQYAHS